MMLPRCIHDIAGVGLDDGGFHQVLNRLFSEDARFEGLTAEDREGFRSFWNDLGTDADRRTILRIVRGLLLRAYGIVLGDQAVHLNIGRRLEKEIEKISTEGRS